MYGWRNIEARSCNHCCSGNGISITYSEWMFVALVIQRAMRMRHIFYNIFHVISLRARFSKNSHWTQNVCFDFLYDLYLKHFSFWEEMSEILLKMYIGVHVKCRLLLADCNETWIFSRGFRKILNCQISWKSVQWEQSCSMRSDRGRTDMTKLMVAIRKFC
jgi:hypothetical protein